MNRSLLHQWLQHRWRPLIMTDGPTSSITLYPGLLTLATTNAGVRRPGYTVIEEVGSSDNLGTISWIYKSTLQLYRRNVPLLHTSRYVIARDWVLPGLSSHQYCKQQTLGWEGNGYSDGVTAQIKNTVLSSVNAIRLAWRVASIAAAYIAAYISIIGCIHTSHNIVTAFHLITCMCQAHSGSPHNTLHSCSYPNHSISMVTCPTHNHDVLCIQKPLNLTTRLRL